MPQSYTIRGCQRGTWRSVSISVNGGPPPRPRNPGPRGRTFARRSSAASRCAASVAPSPARKPRSLPAWRDERNTRNFVLALRPRGYNSGMRRFRVSLAQINPTVGDVEGNTRRIVDGIAQARALGADLVAFPELAITGYPPEDLLFKSAFIEANLAALADVTKAARGLTAVVGFVDKRQDLFNAAAVIHDGALAGVYHKQYLPNYGVFDENRYFQAGREASVFSFGQTCVAVNVCEDLWYPTGPTTPPALGAAAAGAGADGRAAAARRRGLPGARARHPRLRPQERLQARGHRALGRHRLRAGGGGGGRGSRPRERDRRHHALAVLLARHARRRAAAGEEPRHRVPAAADHAGLQGLPEVARAALQGPQGGRDRGKHPGAHSRHAAHGAVEQVRLARADHGQQERDRRRLLHPLR